MTVTVDDILNSPFSNRAHHEKLRIVAEGKPRPFLNMAAVVTMNNETDSGELRTHQFNPAMYDEVRWLTGCDKRDTFFCWPCLLFMPSVGLWNTTGISDLVYLLEGMPKHEETLEHVQSALKLQKMVELSAKTTVIDVSQHNEIVKRNRAILKRMIDVACNLLAKEQPYYERNSGCELSPENCVKNLQFLRGYDLLNCNFIEDAIDLIQITPNIVKDLVDTIAREIKIAVRKEIQASTYVSIILSDHSKISEKPQFSTVLRYIKEGKVCERYIGFTNISNLRRLNIIYEHILSTINEFNLSERLLALSIDGGVLQTPDLTDLIGRMKNMHPFAFFVPWYGHGLDYVLQQSLANMKECSAFFKTMNEMKIYLQKKSKRFKALETFMSANLPSTKDTRWFVRSQFIQVVNMHRKHFILFFESVLQNSTMWDPDDVTKALGFQQILEEFHTVFLLETFSRLFDHTIVLNKILKSSLPENVFGSKTPEELNAELLRERDSGFEELWVQVHSEKCIELPGPVSKRIKTDFEDSQLVTYRELYYSIVNRMIQEIDVRFLNLSKLSFCQLLNCDTHGNFTFNNELLKTLVAVHGAYFDEEQIRNELIVLRTNGTVFCKKTVYDLLQFFIKAKLKGGFKYLYKLAEFILTLPIKPTSAENSIAKFQEIKDWSYVPEEPGPRPGDVCVPCVELDFLQELKKSNSFHDEIAVIFYELNKTFELLQK